MPRLEGIESFKGRSFHTHYWPHEPIDLAGKRVAVVGTGATGIQVMTKIADKFSRMLTVLQRRPNWSAPLNNSTISEAEMAEIRARYEEIFAIRTRSASFLHQPDHRGFYEISREERLKLWDKLYDEPGFGIWLANFQKIYVDEAANAESVGQPHG